MLRHLDHFGCVHDLDGQLAHVAVLGELGVHARLLTHQDDLRATLARLGDRAGYNDFGRVIPAHGIHDDFHGIRLSMIYR